MDSWFNPQPVTPRVDIIPPMRSRLLHVGIVFILVVCLVCRLVEMFDRWDRTLQTGIDSEYTLVLLALCVGVNTTRGLKKSLCFNQNWACPSAQF